MTSDLVTTVLNPAAEGPVASHVLAPRLTDLRGITVGLIDNHKGNSDVYLEALAGLFKEQFGVGQVINYRKDSQSIPTPPEVLDDLASQCQAIVHAVADWGSCTAWGLHDGIESEKRGVPAVTVITTAFTKAAELRAKALGLPEHPVVVIGHPMYSKTGDEVLEQARRSVQVIVDGLTVGKGGNRNG